MDVIKIYPNQDLLYEDSKGIEIGDIFVNNENGEVIVSTTAEGNLLSALMDALDAARSTNLTLEFEGIDMIDGAEALVLYSRIIEPTDEEYITVLRYFLSFEYGWEADVFDFDLVEVSEWIAYNDEEAVIKFQQMEDGKEGFLISAGSGLVEPETHPFLNVRFQVEGEEAAAIGNIIDESENFVDFMTLLVENGYLVVGEDWVSLLK